MKPELSIKDENELYEYSEHKSVRIALRKAYSLGHAAGGAQERENNSIWCDTCGSIQPLRKDALSPGIDVTGKFRAATDYVCATCYLVICTSYAAIRAGSEP